MIACRRRDGDGGGLPLTEVILTTASADSKFWSAFSVVASKDDRSSVFVIPLSANVPDMDAVVVVLVSVVGSASAAALLICEILVRKVVINKYVRYQCELIAVTKSP